MAFNKTEICSLDNWGYKVKVYNTNTKVKYVWKYKNIDVEMIIYFCKRKENYVSYSFIYKNKKYKDSDNSCLLGAWDKARDKIDSLISKSQKE